MPVSGGNIGSTSDVLQAQLEVVRKRLQDYFDGTTSYISDLINKSAEVEQISQKLYRIPIRLFRGGSFQKFDANAGDMGNGSGMKVDKLTAGYIYSNLAFELSQESIDTTSNTKQAVVNNFQDTLANAMDQIQVYDDIVFHTDGSGKVTNSGSAYTSADWNTTYDSMTFAGTTDTLGINRLIEGMVVNVFDSTGATKRTTVPSPLQIDHIDYTAKKVYFNGTITSGANTDILVFAGLSATLASFQSGWPLTGDSFRHGMYYANDATGSNYYLGQLKSAMTALIPTRVNAASSPLTFPMGLLVRDGLTQRRDESVLSGMVGVAHMSQRSAVFSIGMAISNWMRDEKAKSNIDVMPNNNGMKESFDFCDFKCYVSKRQDRARFDFVNPKLWGRAHLHPAKFHEVGGNTIFEGRTSGGNLKASQFFAIVQAFDFVNFDPGAGAYIDSLVLPSGY